jgi:hypothetical protein
MKTGIRFLTVLLLVLTILGEYTTASAGGGTNNGHFRDLGADAYFYSTDPSGCVVTEVNLLSTQHYFQSPPGPGAEGPFVSLQVFQYNVCTGEQLISASGGTQAANIQVDRKLNWAALSATVNVWEDVSQTYQDIYLDLTWTATGPSVHLNDHFHFKSPGCHLMARSNGIYRPATASGSVSNGITNFTPDASSGASIYTTKSGNLTVGCD